VYLGLALKRLKMNVFRAGIADTPLRQWICQGAWKGFTGKHIFKVYVICKPWQNYETSHVLKLTGPLTV